jgi:hypothetical protein
MPTKREDPGKTGAPRTDLPPKREPYYEGYFGTGEEETAERERDASGDARDGDEERSRRVAEDAAGGDREI